MNPDITLRALRRGGSLRDKAMTALETKAWMSSVDVTGGTFLSRILDLLDSEVLLALARIEGWREAPTHHVLVDLARRDEWNLYHEILDLTGLDTRQTHDAVARHMSFEPRAMLELVRLGANPLQELTEPALITIAAKEDEALAIELWTYAQPWIRAHYTGVAEQMRWLKIHGFIELVDRIARDDASFKNLACVEYEASTLEWVSRVELCAPGGGEVWSAEALCARLDAISSEEEALAWCDAIAALSLSYEEAFEHEFGVARAHVEDDESDLAQAMEEEDAYSTLDALQRAIARDCAL